MKAESFSRAGAYHAYTGEENQDAVWTSRGRGVATAVVCDGAGSFRRGGTAARIVAETVGRILSTTFDALYTMDSGFVRRYLVQRIWMALRDEAGATGTPEQELACTLVAAAMDRQGRVICLHLGDGAVLARHQDGTTEVLSRPENGLSGKQVTFLTMNCDMFAHLRCRRWRDGSVRALCLMTDGAAEHLTDRETQWSDPELPWETKKLAARLGDRNPEDDFSFALISR